METIIQKNNGIRNKNLLLTISGYMLAILLFVLWFSVLTLNNYALTMEDDGSSHAVVGGFILTFLFTALTISIGIITSYIKNNKYLRKYFIGLLLMPVIMFLINTILIKIGINLY